MKKREREIAFFAEVEANAKRAKGEQQEPERCPYGSNSVSACRLPAGHEGNHVRFLDSEPRR
jgi:hypothetical protein